MKRDLNLIRKLVLTIEESPTGFAPDEVTIEGYTPDQIGYHAYLLVDAGLAMGVDLTALGDTSPNWRILHLTSAGHDFADAARDDNRWRKAADIARDKVGTASVDVMKQILIGLIKQAIGL